MTITYCPRIYTNDTLIFYSHRRHRRHRNCTSWWLVDWRSGGKCCCTTFPVVCRVMPLESKLSDGITLQMTTRCSGLHLATSSIYEWNFGYTFFIMVMNFGHCSLNIWRDSLNKESVSGRLLTLESLLSDGSKLILTSGCSFAPLQIFNPFVIIMTYVHESRLHSA